MSKYLSISIAMGLVFGGTGSVLMQQSSGNAAPSVLVAQSATPDSAMKGDAMKGDAMKGDAMKGDAMKGDAMKGDAMKGDAMKGDAMKGDAMKGDAMKGDAMKKAGGLVSVEAKTTGTATVVTESGKSYVQFSKDFTIGEAPAIRVTLYRDAVPPRKGYDAKKYVLLGNLKSRSGAQRYVIPGNVTLTDYGSIAVWCQKFDVTLAYSKLASAS